MITKTIIKLLLVLFVTILVFLTIYNFFFSIKYNDSYLEIVKSKREKLDKIQYPKIVITGDISIASGIDSKVMEDELGVPVVNMATNSSIGYRKILSYIKRDLNKNDILIFSPSYDISTDRGWNGLSDSDILEANSIFKPNMFYEDNLKNDLSVFENK